MDHLLRSILFVPADNESYIKKAMDSDADAIIFDLEDAISPALKDRTRDALREILGSVPNGKPVFVRVNPTDSPWFLSDLSVCAHKRVSGFFVPKTASRDDVVFTDRILGSAERAKGFETGRFALVPMIESARGVVELPNIISASPRVTAVSFGAYDYRNNMRIMADASQEFQNVPRVLLAIAARAAGVLPIDTPYFAVKDKDGLRAEKNEAAGLGFAGSLIITPSHAAICNEAFSPKGKDIEYSRGVLAALEQAERDGEGVALYNGLMIDAPVRELAEYIRDYERLIAGRDAALPRNKAKSRV